MNCYFSSPIFQSFSLNSIPMIERVKKLFLQSSNLLGTTFIFFVMLFFLFYFFKFPSTTGFIYQYGKPRFLYVPVHEKHQTDSGAHTILVAVTVSFAVFLLVFAILILLHCRKKITRFRGISERTNQVGFDPGPYLFYLNSLGCYLESDTSTKQSPISKNVLSEIIKGGSPSYSREHKELDEEIICIEVLSSDDESFHSVCNSHCSGDIDLVTSNECFSQQSPKYISVHSHTPNIQTSPCLSPESSESRTLPAESYSKIQDDRSLRSSYPYISPCIDPKIPKPPLMSGNSPSSSFTSNNRIPKPPAPPPPPLVSSRPLSMQKQCNSSHLPHTPIGKDGTPLPKLKPLHWDKVRAAPDHSMVWDNIRLSSFELDEDMIGSLFGYNLQSSAKSESKSKTASPTKHILEPKRLQNLTILFKALNATTDQVRNALMQGRGLDVQQLETLVKMIPSKDEEEKLSNYGETSNELAPAENFLKEILRVPFAFHKTEGLLYKETFNDEVNHLKKSLASLREACEEIRSSWLFLKLLEAVLKTGNRMNVGTIRGGARAFKLDALLKLSDIKGTDGKTTLLHFVVQEMIKSKSFHSSAFSDANKQDNNFKLSENKTEEEYRTMSLNIVSGLSNELFNVRKAATIDLDILRGSVSNLNHGMKKLKHLLTEELSTDGKDESFLQSMNPFYNHAEKVVMELNEEEEQVLVHVKETTEYYHGEVSKEEGSVLRIFVIVRDFLGMLDRVCKEVRCLKNNQGPKTAVAFR